MTSHPRGLYVLFFTEMWERFGFYTIIAIFTLYMKAPPKHAGLGMETSVAGFYYSIFMGLVYFSPLFGGLAADLIIGERKAIVIGAIFLACGYFCLAVPPSEGSLTLFLMAILAIVIGNGFFKPNISTMVGNLYPEDSPLRDAGFNIFYTGINLGAVAAPFVAMYLRTRWNWQVAFGAAGVGMLISMAIFLFNRGTFAGALIKQSSGLEQTTKDHEDRVGTTHRLGALGILLLVSTVFWSLFFQNGFTLTLWADDCTLKPTWITPELFQAVNPAFIVLLSSAAAMFWRWMGKLNKEPSTPDKILLGLFAAIFACGVMVLASLMGGDACKPKLSGEVVSMAWLIGTYTVISLAEILVSPMGLSYCTKVAPKNLGGLVMGGWFASLGAGGYISGAMGSHLWDTLPHSTYFIILAGALLLVSVLLLNIRGLLNRAAG